MLVFFQIYYLKYNQVYPKFNSEYAFYLTVGYSILTDKLIKAPQSDSCRFKTSGRVFRLFTMFISSSSIAWEGSAGVYGDLQ